MSLLIIIIWIWFVAFIILGETCKLMPFFEKGIAAWIAAAILMLLLGISGGLSFIAKFILSIPKAFKFLEDWSAGALIASIIGLLIITMAIVKIEKYFKKKAGIAQAQMQGMNVGTKLGFLARMKDFLGLAGN